jgi:hypothetical protein
MHPGGAAQQDHHQSHDCDQEYTQGLK